MLFFDRMLRLVRLPYVKELIVKSLKPKSNADKLEVADSGDLEDIDVGEESREEGPKAVRRRLRELRGCNGWNFGIFNNLCSSVGVVSSTRWMLNVAYCQQSDCLLYSC